MKRVFSILVMGALLSGAVWAQDDEEGGAVQVGGGTLTISGGVQTGLRMDSNSKVKSVGGEKVQGTKEALYLYSDNIDDGTGFRADLGAEWTNGRVGAKINLRQNVGELFTYSGANLSQSSWLDFGGYYPVITNAYAWVNLFSGIITVSGGIIDDDVWGTYALAPDSTYTNTAYDAVKGFRIAVQPIDGLSIGAAWKLDEWIEYNADPTASGNGGEFQDSYIGSGDIEKPDGADGKYTLGQFFGGSVFGVSYLNEAFGGANVSLRLNRAASYVDKNGKFQNDGSLGVDLLLGVKITPASLSALTVLIDGEFRNLGFDKALLDGRYQYRITDELKDAGLDFAINASYKVLEPLKVGLRFHLKNYVFTDDDDWDGGMGELIGQYMEAKEKKMSEVIEDFTCTDLDIRLYGSYAVTEWLIPGLQLQLNFGGKPTKVIDELKIKSVGDNKYADFKSFDIKPSVTFKLGESLTFVVYDKISIFGDYFYGNNNQAKKAEDFNKGYVGNRLQLDFVWAF